jgi:hypothetical protein
MSWKGEGWSWDHLPQLTLAVGDLVEVTDFGTDWWTGIKQKRRSETTACGLGAPLFVWIRMKYVLL